MTPLISALLPTLGKVVDRLVPDKAQAQKIQNELLVEVSRQEADLHKAAASVIIAEAKSESWITRSWRPITMLTFVALVALHWLGFTPENITEKEVTGLLDIVKVGLGGFVIGRSGEKMMKAWKGVK